MSYSFEELTDMLSIYGEAKNNGRQAVRLYEQKFPNRRIPNHSTFASIEMRLRETGNLRTKRNNTGRPRTTRTIYKYIFNKNHHYRYFKHCDNCFDTQCLYRTIIDR
nr:unnamed protein product [Callosobruchus chinensis]